MRRFKSVLFSPLGRDDNPASVRRIADLAARNSAELTLFGVVGEPSGLQRLLHRSDTTQAVLSAERKELTKKLERWARRADGIPITTEVVAGNPALTIIDRVIANAHDLVVVTTDEDHEDQATIKRLLRKTPCPVWVIRPTRARIQRVLAAVDPDPEEFELNRTVLELASSLVELYGGELHLAHAWELYGEAAMRSSTMLSFRPTEITEMIEEERVGRRNALDKLLSTSKLADAPWQIHLQKGAPGAVVGDLVVKHRINLLVMGTVARTGVAGLVMGNTAEHVLDQVRCSVIAVKPPGFVSPLQVPAN